MQYLNKENNEMRQNKYFKYLNYLNMSASILFALIVIAVSGSHQALICPGRTNLISAITPPSGDHIMH